MKHNANADLSAKSKEGDKLSSSKHGATSGMITKQRRNNKGSTSFKSEHPELKKSNRTFKRGNTGRNNVEKWGGALPFAIQVPVMQAQTVGTSFQKVVCEIPALFRRRSPDCVEKLNLQLIPIDKVTQQMLEKDKHNPYLELTLGPQKKIASIVKHLNTKWGTSNTAPGELMLFPFSARVGNLSAYKRWTLLDTNTTAADVYAAVGNPSVFRLRYGWFPNSERDVMEVPFIPLDTEGNLLTGEKEHPYGERSKGHEPLPIDSINHEARELTMLDRVTETAEKDNVRESSGASLSWLDSLSNISFGALLSQVSPTRSTNSGQTLPYTSLPNIDSFDADIAAFAARQQGTCISSQVPSLFDAEQTCHGFPVEKTAFSGKEAPPSSKGASSSVSSNQNTCNQNTDTNLMRFHNMTQVVLTQAGTNREGASDEHLHPKYHGSLESIDEMQPGTEDGACEESTAELQQYAQGSQNNDNDSGMMDIFRAEAIGPWQYGAASSKQDVGGDNVGFSGLFESSLDAFQTFSIF